MVELSKRWTCQKALTFIYHNLPSFIAPVPHGPELPVLNPLQGDETGNAIVVALKSAGVFGDSNYNAEGGNT